MAEVEKLAVIDIGSNSIRMVIYERSGSALLPYFNEKTMAELGRDLQSKGRLNPDGVSLALETFRRFQAILSSLKIEKVFAVATSAVRESEDGEDFQRAAVQALRTPVRILTGSEEGALAAMGVGFGFSHPRGLVADLGGSSLELHQIGEDDATRGESFLLGPLARSDDESLSLRKRRKAIRRELGSSVLLGETPEHLYAVGGAWRNIAAVHMMLTDYPLGVVHAMALSRGDLARVIEAADGARHHKSLRVKLQNVAKRRYKTLLHAALLLDTLLEKTNLNKAIISANGLREGVIAEGAGINPGAGLIDTVKLYLRLPDASQYFGSVLFDFVQPLSEELGISAPVLEATCMMADAGARMHPDHRADLVFEQIVRAPLPDLRHKDRLLAATAVAFRYSSRFEVPAEMKEIMSSRLVARAELLGLAMRLGGVISGRSGDLLARAGISLDSEELVLQIETQDRELVSETVRRRHRQLAEKLGLEPRILVGGDRT